MNINLHIERLILDGLPIDHGQDSIVKAAVETELACLLDENGVNPYFQSGGAFPNMPARTMHVGKEIHPNRLGKKIASSVYRSIGQS